MANRVRGEVAFEASGKTWTLRYSTNSLCELEDALGLPVNKIIAGLQDRDNVRIKTIRAVVWAGLRDRHAEITLAEAGELISDAGLGPMTTKVGEAFAAAFPETESGEDAARPPTGEKAGTGKDS